MDKPFVLSSLQERLLNEIFCRGGMTYPIARRWSNKVTESDWLHLYLSGFIQRAEHRKEMIITQAGRDYLAMYGWI